jgi:site-specific recombinase XerC
MQAGQSLTKANDIFVRWRLSGQELTMPEFLKEFNNKLSKTNFCDYYEHKLDERHRTEEISELSYKAQRATLRKLKEFSQLLPFANLKASNFARKFDLFLEKKKKSSANTRWARHKDVKTYLHLAAEKDNIRFDDPYKDFKVSKVKGKWVAALPREIELLDTYYGTLSPGSTRRRYLRRWLFGVATGLRLSDQQQARRDWLYENTLIFLMHKGRRKKAELTLPIGARALELWEDALNERDGEDGHTFIGVTGKQSNEMMEVIRQDLGIRSKLHNHVGRESFATLYLENGGSLEVLREYMGHAYIETTMKYVHVSVARKRRDLVLVDRIFNRQPPAVPSSSQPQ